MSRTNSRWEANATVFENCPLQFKAVVLRMGLFKKLTGWIDGAESRIEEAKIVYSEKKAIRKKRPLFRNVSWTEKESAEFLSFWVSHYGKKFPPDWHKLYQSMNGHFDIKYFPEILYTSKLEPLLNPQNYCDVFSDKNLLEVLFGDEETVRTPKTFFGCANGTCFDGRREVIPETELVKGFSDIGDAVIKPTVDTGSGRDVCVVSMHDGTDIKSGRTVENLLSSFGRNFVVQEKLTPCEEMLKLAPNCVSTIRLITFIANHQVFHAPLVLRVGTGNSDVDNIHAGGLCVGMKDDGTLKRLAYRLGYGDKRDTFEVHPDSQITFFGYRIPSIETMISAAYRLHERVLQLGIISWDFTVDDCNKVVLIEANCRDQSVWFPQIVNECALFGENTEYMLELLRKGR